MTASMACAWCENRLLMPRSLRAASEGADRGNRGIACFGWRGGTFSKCSACMLAQDGIALMHSLCSVHPRTT